MKWVDYTDALVGVCPECEANNLNYDEPVLNDGLSYPFTCPKCGCKGYECYWLEFSGMEIKEGGDKG